jgi:hypothetical protein
MYDLFSLIRESEEKSCGGWQVDHSDFPPAKNQVAERATPIGKPIGVTFSVSVSLPSHFSEGMLIFRLAEIILSVAYGIDNEDMVSFT